MKIRKTHFTNDELRSVLNFDTNFRNVFTLEERLTVHSAISYCLQNGSEQTIRGNFNKKLHSILHEIKEINYQHVRVV